LGIPELNQCYYIIYLLLINYLLYRFRPGPEIDAGQLEQVREAAARLIESQQQIDNQFINLAFVPDNK
jgi:hypothetical protein